LHDSLCGAGRKGGDMGKEVKTNQTGKKKKGRGGRKGSHSPPYPYSTNVKKKKSKIPYRGKRKKEKVQGATARPSSLNRQKKRQ